MFIGWLIPTSILTTILTITQINAYSLSSNIDAQLITLYPLSSVTMPSQQYTFTFNRNFTTSTPTFAFGINQYKMGDQFYTQNFKSEQTGLTASTASITTTSTGATSPKLFSISYIAVQNQSNIAINLVTYLSATNISSGSGSRYLQVFYSYNFTSNNVLLLPLLTGFYITSGLYFMINATASIVSTLNYQVRIQTIQDSLIHRATMYILICEEEGLTAANYYYFGGEKKIFSNDANNASVLATINDYNDTVFILGIRGFDGFTATSSISWGWSLQSTNNGVATISIDKNNLVNIYFSLFQIANKGVSTTNTQPQASSGGISLGIIAGLIVGIIILTIAIFIFCRFYWRRQSYTVPIYDNFKMMPSLSV